MKHCILSLVLVTCCSLAICFEPDDKNNHPNTGSSDLKEVRDRWNVKNIIRDIDHIKEDMKKITNMQQTGAISKDEALFYFIRMHDFDNNDELDGLEILAALYHVTETRENIPFETKEKYVDNILTYDHNLNGFISYEELQDYTRTTEAYEGKNR